MEPISPELVLVDPELAARVRAAAVAGPGPYLLDSRDVASFPTELAARPLETAGGTATTGRRDTFRRARRSLVAVGLLVSGFFAGAAVSGSGTQRPQFVLEGPAGTVGALEASRSAGTVADARRSAAGRTKARVRPAADGRRRARASARTRRTATPRRVRRTTTTPKRRRQTRARLAAQRRTSAAVERKLLSLIVHAPAGKLPAALIETKTGFAKNNLQAVCRRSDDRRSFLCIVTSALQPAAPPVYAFYRPTKNGRGDFTWYRSQDG